MLECHHPSWYDLSGLLVQKLCCELAQKLAENCTIAARLHYEAVVLLACNGGNAANHVALAKAVTRTQNRAEQMMVAFEEHVETHKRRRRPRPVATSAVASKPPF